jgi:hypothetical protein
MKTPRRSRRRDDRGVVAIEFVLIAPVLLMLIFAIASFGPWFYKQVQVSNDARNVARSIALGGPNWTPPSSLPSGATIQSDTTCPAGNTTSDAVVTLTYPDAALVSLPFLNTPPTSISSTGRMRCGG